MRWPQMRCRPDGARLPACIIARRGWTENPWWPASSALHCGRARLAFSNLSVTGVPALPVSEREDVRRWFVDMVLPHEAALTAFLRKHWREAADIADFRQETYARMIGAARNTKPSNAKAFMFKVARNLLINQVRRNALVQFDLSPQADDSMLRSEDAGPERIASGRNELRLVRAAVGRLPPRAQEIFLLRKVEGLSLSEIAQQTGLSAKTVENHLTIGIRTLAGIMHETGLDGALDRHARHPAWKTK